MITDEKAVIKFIAEWLASYTKQAGITMVIANDRGVSLAADAVTIHLCREAAREISGLKVHVNKVDLYRDTDTTSFMWCVKYASEHNGIVVGPTDKTYGLYTRGFDKHGEALADIFPLFDLELSDVDKLYKSMKIDGKLKYPDGYQSIEFCNEAEEKYGIITRDDPPHTHPRWAYFTTEQKRSIALVHQREKKTRHKKMTKPYPIIPASLCKRTVQ